MAYQHSYTALPFTLRNTGQKTN